MTVFRKVLVGALFVFSFLSTTGASYAQDQNLAPPNCSLTKLASYNILLSPHGDVMIDMDIDGTTRRMIVDTSDGRSLVTGAVRKDLNVYEQTLSPKLVDHIETVHGVYAKTYIEIPHLKFGAATLDNVDALIAWNSMPLAAIGADGVIGMDVLHNFDVELDLGHGKLNLFSPDHCAGQGLYWTHQAAVVPFELDAENKFRFFMQLDDKPVSVGISSRAGTTVLQGYVAKEKFGLDEDMPGVKVIIKGGKPAYDILRYQFHTLSATGIAISNPSVDFPREEGSERCDGSRHAMYWFQSSCIQPDLRLSGNMLGQLRLYFAVKEKKVYITGFNASLDDVPTQGGAK